MAVLSRFASDDLPDLPLLALMSQMSANDRLAAYQVCPRWGHRVLEVNKTLKVSSLTIAVIREANETHANANEQGNLQLLTSLKEEEEEEGKRKEDGDEAKKKSLQFFLSLLPRQSQWNCLEFKHGQLTPAIVRQIMAAFPGITELTFLLNMANNWKNPPSHQANFNQLFTVLTSDENKKEEEEGSWKAQLHTLRVINRDRGDLILESTFYKALCLLPALRNLTLYDLYLGPKQQLAVLGQLEQVTLSFNSVLCYHSLVSSLQKCIKVQKTEESFFSSLLKCFKVNRKEESDPPAAVLPRVSLPTLEPCLISELLLTKLNSNVRRTLVRLPTVDHSSRLFRQVCTAGRFPGLVSLSLCTTSTHISQVFSTLSRSLPSLRYLTAHLELKLLLEDDEELEELLTLEQPLASVQALHLKVSLTRARLAHDNLRWLNIGQLMPNLKALHLNVLECRGCGIGRWWSAKTVPQKKSAVPCLRELLQIVAHNTGLPPRRITYQQQEVFGPTEHLISSL
ncbi:hypothetical protein TYRP_017149 [Tyrophagus putrescentiae]|nr:hypothetical protein TYRP_017149 [Tyrophagus putrescentiae]